MCLSKQPFFEGDLIFRVKIYENCESCENREIHFYLTFELFEFFSFFRFFFLDFFGVSDSDSDDISIFPSLSSKSGFSLVISLATFSGSNCVPLPLLLLPLLCRGGDDGTLENIKIGEKSQTCCQNVRPDPNKQGSVFV